MIGSEDMWTSWCGHVWAIGSTRLILWNQAAKILSPDEPPEFDVYVRHFLVSGLHLVVFDIIYCQGFQVKTGLLQLSHNVRLYRT